VLVLQEASTTGGFGGEVAARIAQDGFDFLDAPVTRLGSLDTPVPFAKGLEKQYMPAGRLESALEDLLDY
jgi:2-oxoisovalerate dehydrogenase E1 component